MKNTINYYYNLNPDKINRIFDYYYFYIDNELYYFKIFDRNVNDIQAIYEFNREMIKRNILVNEIIDNRTHTIVTYIHQIPYMLTRVCVNINKLICLSEISYLSNVHIPYPEALMRTNWANLWIDKIDYLEYHHEQNYQKYPILSSCFDYFIGLSENAISYLNQTVFNMNPDQSDIGVISHNTLLLDDTIYSLYDPQNIIIDHKARDLAEYIKLSFFRDNYSIFDELDEYFQYNYFSIYGIHLLMARILYPSFYFDVYDDVINNRKNESSVLKITARINDFQIYLADVWKYFHKYYPIKDINWLFKNNSFPS